MTSGLARGFFAAALLSVGQASFADRGAGLSGVWRTYGDDSRAPEALVEIVESGGQFSGSVLKVFSPPAKSAHPRCEECPGELRDKPVVGITILRGMRWDGSGYSGGEILDPDDGITYRCRMRLLDGGARLEVRAFIGAPLFGRNQVWLRAR